MPKTVITIKNIDAIKAAFVKAPREMTDELNNAIKKSIFDIQSQSMQNSPVLTGRLRASHETLFGQLRGEVGPTVNYAIFVHEGTKFMKGRPFLLDAVKSRTQHVQDYFTKAVQIVLDKIGDQT